MPGLGPIYTRADGFPSAQKLLAAGDISDDADRYNQNNGNALNAQKTKFAQLLWVAAAGDVTVMDIDGNTVLYDAVLAGQWHNTVPFKNVQKTDTAATGITVGYLF